jgi:hypothetical protein
MLSTRRRALCSECGAAVQRHEGTATRGQRGTAADAIQRYEAASARGRQWTRYSGTSALEQSLPSVKRGTAVPLDRAKSGGGAQASAQAPRAGGGTV